MIKIKPSDKGECKDIARLHAEYIKTGFLSSLGKDFLGLLYESVVSSNHAFCIVAKDGDKVIGFISGTTDIGKF